MSDQFEVTVSDGEAVVGPVTMDQIRRGLVAGKLPAESKARRVGTSEWTPIAILVASALPTDTTAATSPSPAPATPSTESPSLGGASSVNKPVVVLCLLGLSLLLFALFAWNRRNPARSQPAASGSASVSPDIMQLDPEQAGIEGFKAYDGKPRDEARAVRFWKQSCDGGSQLGCTGIGFTKMWGLAGTPKDYPKALEHLEAGCTAGVMRACALVGQMALNGWGGPKDLPRARTRWEKACSGGEPRGCYFLGIARRAKDVPADWYDPELGRALLDKACAANYADACEEVAAIQRQVDQAKEVEGLRRKVKRKYWSEEPDGQCTGKGFPPYRWDYEGGTFAEDEKVAKADGCTKLYQTQEIQTYCCPTRPVTYPF
jgi:hypothetical protein